MNWLSVYRRPSNFAGFLVILLFAAQLGTPRAQEKQPLLYEEPRHLDGRIYGLKDEALAKPLFTFTRRCERKDSQLDVLREYKYPDGQIASRERVVYQGNDLVSYELEELQIGARGKATIVSDSANQRGKVILFERQTGNKLRRGKEPLPPNAIVSDMLAPFLMGHWDGLLKGEKVKCRYIVVERLETIGFTFSRQSDSVWQGKPVVVVRMEPTSRIISALVDPLYFTIEKASPHRIFQYVGRTTPKLKSGRKFVELDGRTVFEW